MTNTNNSNEDIREIILELARKQNRTQDQILQTQEQLLSTEYLVRDLTSDASRVLARSAILDDVLLELRDNQEILQRNFEVHQQNFTEHQRTTNAALDRLEAILLQLIQRNN